MEKQAIQMSQHKRLHLRITGVVQGVFFRACTRDEARQLGLGGWVRNRADGSVEAVAEGPEETLGRLASWCEQGSPGSRVERVERTWDEATGEFTGFSIRY
jgi:acylphosphatase